MAELETDDLLDDADERCFCKCAEVLKLKARAPRRAHLSAPDDARRFGRRQHPAVRGEVAVVEATAHSAPVQASEPKVGAL